MKINKPEKANVIFGSLNNGDVFRLPGDDLNYFMRIEACSDEDDFVNCIYLDDGSVSCIKAETEVIPIDCELVIK